MIAQLVKNLPAMQEILVQFLGRENLPGDPWTTWRLEVPTSHAVQNPGTAFSASKTKELINDSPKGRKLKQFG